MVDDFFSSFDEALESFLIDVILDDNNIVYSQLTFFEDE